jgi:hypothetical protein
LFLIRDFNNRLNSKCINNPEPKIKRIIISLEFGGTNITRLIKTKKDATGIIARITLKPAFIFISEQLQNPYPLSLEPGETCLKCTWLFQPANELLKLLVYEKLR